MKKPEEAPQATKSVDPETDKKIFKGIMGPKYKPEWLH